ncbi:MAG: oligoendopeptidase F [Alphaproteobacteria bacterium]|jgi:oligoendopeptidase F
MTSKKVITGAENVRWDLSALYQSMQDPQIDADLNKLIKLIQNYGGYKGQLSTSLGAAITADCEITDLGNKLEYFMFLNTSTDVTNEAIKQRSSQISEAVSKAAALHMNFFSHEVVALDEAVYQGLLKTDAVVKHHKPMLDEIREQAKYMLAEDVEQALSMRSPFGGGEWDDFCDEMEAELSFSIQGKEHTLTEALHVMSEGEDAAVRLEALKSVNSGLADQYFTRYRSRALNLVMGSKAVSDDQRGYATPMSSRNIGSKVDDATVDALHEAVNTVGADEAQRFYKLKAEICNFTLPMPWSDRNANLPFASKSIISWDDTRKTVLDAYGSFSPTLAGLVKTILDSNWVDAPAVKGKQGGAFNASGTFPGSEIRSYNFLNHQGSIRDVMTAAHELGHGVHGMLAAEKQGSLMWHAPMVYAETASIFGEMITFNHMLSQITDDQERLVLLMGKVDDFMNTVVRQISFSNFEQKIHAARKDGKLTVGDFNEAWLDVTAELYGADGTLFDHSNMENLWSYVGHFMNPFYVYAYAFGELFTQSLFATKDAHGDKFEPMYLDLLRKGGTEGAVDLMKPFGLDPKDPDFWTGGIKCSVSKWLDEAEVLAKKLGYTK